MAYVPYLLAAAGTAYSAIRTRQQDNTNSQIMASEAQAARDQATQQENLVRRNSREALGKEAAAFGGAGVGYGGSSETALDQSAINQELDALNTRYKGQFVGYGYTENSQLLRQQGQSALGAGMLLAGGQALKGLQSYSSPPPAAYAAGTASMDPSLAPG